MNKNKNKFLLTALSISILSAVIFSTSTLAYEKKMVSSNDLEKPQVIENTITIKENYILNTIDNLSDICLSTEKTLSDIITIIPTQATEIITDENNQLKLIATKGQEVYAPVGGTITEVVSYAKKDRTDLVPTMGFGSVVIIEDTNGDKFMLSHLGSLDCKKGDVLEAGDIIGTTGTTGRATTSMVGLSVIVKDNTTVNIYFDNK